ncbi:MAG TPA: hypothetical protein VJT31_11865 [Rugosimonospora sp.]|nr:hypothetical protein [Rugosimonospora sp.]
MDTDGLGRGANAYGEAGDGFNAHVNAYAGPLTREPTDGTDYMWNMFASQYVPATGAYLKGVGSMAAALLAIKEALDAMGTAYDGTEAGAGRVAQGLLNQQQAALTNGAADSTQSSPSVAQEQSSQQVWARVRHTDAASGVGSV